MVNRLESLWALLLIGLITLGVSACVQTDVMTKSELSKPTGKGRVVLMPVDVELYSLTAGGVAEPRADWTSAAKGQVSSTLRRQLQTQNADLVDYVEPQDPVLLDRHQQLMKLHKEVGATLLKYSITPGLKPPTKKGGLDSSLGPEAVALGESTKTDYGLFVVLRDSYSSAGRKAMMVGAALLGVAVSGGAQVGYASLVDLRSGDVVWFNRLSSNTGDLREADPALAAVQQLVKGIPL
ncbi:MAG: hypothetical protein KJ558_03615 [Gammaproteobacteria bacterium]|nr:hypothetical protein [Gammaproteobacteria bacterium]MBU1653910.1 hypothetical protein [Gammaproteobacteria bacterium]MBU1962339.1 hypothetical protein [Gammaproteobacteria bacterium]